MSITSLASRLAFAVLLIVTAFAAMPTHAQHADTTAVIQVATN